MRLFQISVVIVEHSGRKPLDGILRCSPRRYTMAHGSKVAPKGHEIILIVMRVSSSLMHF
jgi:hypothetical protein